MFFFFIFLLQPRLVNFPRIKIVSLFIDTHHLLDIKLLFCHKRKGTKKKKKFMTRFNVVHQLLNFVLSFQYLNNWWKLYSTKACITIFLGKALWEEILTFVELCVVLSIFEQLMKVIFHKSLQNYIFRQSFMGRNCNIWI